MPPEGKVLPNGMVSPGISKIGQPGKPESLLEMAGYEMRNPRRPGRENSGDGLSLY
jgi:hypothetical protein